MFERSEMELAKRISSKQDAIRSLTQNYIKALVVYMVPVEQLTEVAWFLQDKLRLKEPEPEQDGETVCGDCINFCNCMGLISVASKKCFYNPSCFVSKK